MTKFRGPIFGHVKVLAFLTILALLLGCGYTLKSSLPVSAVRLGKIENLTSEAKLQDRLYEALARELMKSGVQVGAGAAHEIYGTLDNLELESTAEADGVTVVYEVHLEGRFFLRDQDGKERPIRSKGTFIVNFSSSGDMAGVMANKEAAIRSALEDMAEEMVNSVARD